MPEEMPETISEKELTDLENVEFYQNELLPRMVVTEPAYAALFLRLRPALIAGYRGRLKTRNALPALLDEIERLREQNVSLRGMVPLSSTLMAKTVVDQTTRAEAAEAERDAFKAKLEAMREWAEEYPSGITPDDILAVLNAEPARATADEDARGEKELELEPPCCERCGERLRERINSGYCGLCEAEPTVEREG